MTRSSATLAVLITMPHSHFSEKARWALDRLSLPYREEPHAPIERVHGVFKDVDERLNDGRRFLVGERFTAADLTFAALAAPVLFPAGYRAAYPALDDVPAAMRAEVLRLRDTDAGRFALRLFLQERDRSSAVA